MPSGKGPTACRRPIPDMGRFREAMIRLMEDKWSLLTEAERGVTPFSPALFTP